MKYVLDNFCASNHVDYCLVIECDKSIDDIVEICSMINYMHDDLIESLEPGTKEELSEKCLLEILCGFYGCINIKDSVSKEWLLNISMPISWILEKVDDDTYIIDLYSAREICNRSNYEKLSDKWIMKDNLESQIVLNLLEHMPTYVLSPKSRIVNTANRQKEAVM